MFTQAQHLIKYINWHIILLLSPRCHFVRIRVFLAFFSFVHLHINPWKDRYSVSSDPQKWILFLPSVCVGLSTFCHFTLSTTCGQSCPLRLNLKMYKKFFVDKLSLVKNINRNIFLGKDLEAEHEIPSSKSHQISTKFIK